MFKVSVDLCLTNRLGVEHDEATWNTAAGSPDGDILLQENQPPYMLHLYMRQRSSYEKTAFINTGGKKYLRTALSQYTEYAQESWNDGTTNSTKSWSRNDLKQQQSILNSTRENLIGCLAPDSPVFTCRNEDLSYQIRIHLAIGEDMTLQTSPGGCWSHHNLSICGNATNIIVASHHDMTLDFFDHEGKIQQASNNAQSRTPTVINNTTY